SSAPENASSAALRASSATASECGSGSLKLLSSAHSVDVSDVLKLCSGASSAVASGGLKLLSGTSSAAGVAFHGGDSSKLPATLKTPSGTAAAYTLARRTRPLRDGRDPPR